VHSSKCVYKPVLRKEIFYEAIDWFLENNYVKFEFDCGTWSSEEDSGVVNGKIYLTEKNISGLECTLKDKSTDQYIQIVNPSITSNYLWGWCSGISVLEFTITSVSTYELSAQYSNGKMGKK
jgi:hypothetical protein